MEDGRDKLKVRRSARNILGNVRLEPALEGTNIKERERQDFQIGKLFTKRGYE